MKAKSMKTIAIETIILGIILILIWITTKYFIGIAIIQGESMSPTFNNGSIILVEKYSKTYDYNDIVVVDPEHYDTQIIKRIIGLPGDVINIDFDNNTVYRNGELLIEPYIAENTTLEYDTKFPLTVPEGEVFLLGDNRNHSIDSRSSKIGTVPIDHIISKYVTTLKK